jgi:transcriptional regulator with XRE-family HTH domain
MTVFASLGNLIRLKRMERGYNQHDLATLIGWKTIDRLRDIEGDFVQPERGILERMSDVLEFSPEERGIALLLAGIPPSREEEDAMVAELSGDMDAWGVAAYVKDFRWHLIHANRAALTFFNLDADNFVVTNRENMLKLLLDPEAGSIYEEARKNPDWDEFLRLQIANFKEENRHREAQEWYIHEVKGLKVYPAFARIWNDLDDATIDRYSRMRRYKNHEAIQLPPWERRSSKVRTKLAEYQIVAVPVRLDERFRLRLILKESSKLADDTILGVAGSREVAGSKELAGLP